MKLGKIEKMELRDIWAHEALEFTKWLSDSKDNNIQHLNDIIGLNLVDLKTEQNVGGFKCDIVCRDEFSDKTVIIENQLETSNHDHLGKIITYASGLEASVIIWIVKNARQEHASAIEWLNNHTDQSVSFFLIQIEVIKIGDSAPAPQFKVIEAPNDFIKNIKKSVRENGTSERQTSIYEFWTSFNEVLAERRDFNVRKASTDHWYDFAIGTSLCHLSAELINKENRVRLNMYIPDNKDLFDKFYDNKDRIEQVAGIPLVWERLDNKKASRIYTYLEGFSLALPEEYENISNKMIDILSRYKKAFKPYL